MRRRSVVSRADRSLPHRDGLGQRGPGLGSPAQVEPLNRPVAVKMAHRKLTRRLVRQLKSSPELSSDLAEILGRANSPGAKTKNKS